MTVNAERVDASAESQLEPLRIVNLPAWPAPPKSIDELHVSHAVVRDQLLRSVWTQGSANIVSLHKSLKLPFHVLDPLFHQLRQQQLVEVKKTVGLDSTFGLTSAGRSHVVARLDVCQYTGPVPVSLDQYREVVKAQSAVMHLNRDRIREMFFDMVIPDSVLDQLGPSLIAHQSVFLYGKTGAGKTSIAQRLLRIYKEPVLVPYAVEVDGHIITIFDPHVHHVARVNPDNLDARWVVCHRPCVSVGGELSPAMLELRRDETTGVFVAPCQLQANNGILIIDDFGRQIVSPMELLNRWIMPLDQHVDFLTLASGRKFPVPFELMLVLSTNLNPNELVDEAFLRRLHAKILVPDVTPENFDRIFQLVVEEENAPTEAGCAEHLRHRCLNSGSKVLRACYPKDIFRLIKAICRYEGHPVVVNRTLIDGAVEMYFTKSE